MRSKHGIWTLSTHHILACLISVLVVLSTYELASIDVDVCGCQSVYVRMCVYVCTLSWLSIYTRTEL